VFHFQFACFTWVSLLEVLFILLVLIYILDYPSALAGVGSTILFIPPMIKLANRNAYYRGKTAAATDQRVRYISEIIDGIASVKSYAWENPLFALIGTFRNQETKAIAQSQNVRSANQGLMYCTPAIVSFITFVVFWRLGGELTLPIFFSTISLLQVLRASIGRQWTRSMELLSEAIASCERIEAFLIVAFPDDDEPSCLSKVESLSIHEQSNCLLRLKKSSYFYGDDEKRTVLQDIEFELNRGEVMMVVGAVGSGKSSLLAAVLGEIKNTSGPTPESSRYFAPNAKFAYCAQRPWIIAASVQANITMAGKLETTDFKNPAGLDDGLYRSAIESTMLIDDMSRWPAGDRTEIGERGLSISGGQKARVSLARAVYSDADGKNFHARISIVID
jgi:ABC-type multidrug transport system fused ATPase/permease subunit